MRDKYVGNIGDIDTTGYKVDSRSALFPYRHDGIFDAARASTLSKWLFLVKNEFALTVVMTTRIAHNRSRAVVKISLSVHNRPRVFEYRFYQRID